MSPYDGFTRRYSCRPPSAPHSLGSSSASCAVLHAAIVAAASEATRGLANERFESFERPPVNSPTYVAGQPPLAVGEHSSLKSPRAQPSRIDYETPPQRYLRMTH